MKKVYTVTMEDVGEKLVWKRTNDGFSSLELLGIRAMLQNEIMDQMRGIIRPDIIKRECVEQNDQAERQEERRR